MAGWSVVASARGVDKKILFRGLLAIVRVYPFIL